MKKLCGMAVLFTCAWVLWQTNFNKDVVSHSPVQAHEQKIECEEYREQIFQNNQKKGFVKKDGLIRHDGYTWSYT